MFYCAALSRRFDSNSLRSGFKARKQQLFIIHCFLKKKANAPFRFRYVAFHFQVLERTNSPFKMNAFFLKSRSQSAVKAALKIHCKIYVFVRENFCKIHCKILCLRARKLSSKFQIIVKKSLLVKHNFFIED